MPSKRWDRICQVLQHIERGKQRPEELRETCPQPIPSRREEIIASLEEARPIPLTTMVPNVECHLNNSLVATLALVWENLWDSVDAGTIEFAFDQFCEQFGVSI